MADIEVVAYLTHLATQAHATASSQNQARCALSFLYEQVLRRNLGELGGIVRAKLSERKPTFLTTDKVNSIMRHLDGTPYIVAALMFGAGMRIVEVMRLQIQDVDFERQHVLVRDKKGGGGRLVPLPEKVVDALRTQIASAKSIHKHDLNKGLGAVSRPNKISERKRSNAVNALQWQFLFPSPSLSIDPRTRRTHRYHMSQGVLNKAFRHAVSQEGIAKRVAPDILRHSFAINMLALGSDIRVVKELMGHSNLKTTQFYRHATQMSDCPPIPSEWLPTPKQCARLARFNRMLRSGSSLEDIEAKRWSQDVGDYSIYCLAENGKRVRYIGISSQAPEIRRRQHLADCGRGNNLYKENWLRSCVERGIPITIHVVRSGLTAERASLMEFELIRFFKKAFSLVNTHAGGATGYAGLSEESKEKHRINTEKGLIASAQRELEVKDMERGYCLLEEWGYNEEKVQP